MSGGPGYLSVPERFTLYRMFDSDGALLYVGISGRAMRRFREHAHAQSWWEDVARIDIEHLDSRAKLVKAELKAIRTEKPKHNVAGAGRKKAKPQPVSPTDPTADLWTIPETAGWMQIGLTAIGREIDEGWLVTTIVDGVEVCSREARSRWVAGAEYAGAGKLRREL